MRAHDRAIDRRVGAGIGRAFFDDELVAGSVSWHSVRPGKGTGDRQRTCGSMPSGMTICAAASKTHASAARPPSADRDDLLADDTDIRRAGA